MKKVRINYENCNRKKTHGKADHWEYFARDERIVHIWGVGIVKLRTGINEGIYLYASRINLKGRHCYKKHLIYLILPTELDLRTFLEIVSTFDIACMWRMMIPGDVFRGVGGLWYNLEAILIYSIWTLDVSRRTVHFSRRSITRKKIFC